MNWIEAIFWLVIAFFLMVSCENKADRDFRLKLICVEHGAEFSASWGGYCKEKATP